MDKTNSTVPENDECFYSWQFNVRKQFKNKTTEEIKQVLKENAFPFSVLMTQLRGDYNFGSVIRTANNFGASKVFYYGPKRHYDKRSAVGVFNYTDVIYLSTIEQIKELKSEYRFVALENNIERKSISIKDYRWPSSNTLILLGEESQGLPSEILDMADDLIEIPSYGSVPSLNASVAASIAIYDYICKRG
jgi:tRNA G18 (ribose-2'-O)-methylase SpoU